MSLKKSGIEHKKIKETRIATIRFVMKERRELRAALDELSLHIPDEWITGSAFCIFHFVTSAVGGSDVEVGFPVAQTVESGRIKTRLLPSMEVLSLIHAGSPEALGECYTRLFGSASDRHGVISDEFCREVYLDSNDPEGDRIELQMVIHDWSGLFIRNLRRVLGEDAAREIVEGAKDLTPDAAADERFRWTRAAVEKLDELADEDQKYDILSSCAHVFPKEQIEKLRTVYEEEVKRTGQPLSGVDAVIEFMGADPGWGERPTREGRIIYASKNPRNPEGYDHAKTESERKKAYCFCPLVRNHLDGGMPETFCYCGSGWYRQQWEGVIGKEVRIEIEESILRGDNGCRFAIQLPDDL